MEARENVRGGTYTGEIPGFPAIYILVITQVVFATKSLGARRTDKRSLVGVGTNVDLEVVRLGELTLAEAADVLCRAGAATNSTAVFIMQTRILCIQRAQQNRRLTVMIIVIWPRWPWYVAPIPVISRFRPPACCSIHGAFRAVYSWHLTPNLKMYNVMPWGKLYIIFDFLWLSIFQLNVGWYIHAEGQQHALTSYQRDELCEDQMSTKLWNSVTIFSFITLRCIYCLSSVITGNIDLRPLTL